MVFNYKVAVYAGIWGVTLISGEVWVHHLYVSGMVDWIRIGQMVTTLLISVPVGLLLISLVGTLYKGAISFEVPMLYALCFIALFLIGGLTGIPLAVASLTVNLSETYYVVGHFHYVMAVSGTFAIFGAVYYLFPKITGKMFNEKVAKIGLTLSFIGVNMTFWEMMAVGVEGMPRRYYDYAQWPEFVDSHIIMTVGAAILGIGFAINIVNWIMGAINGEKASDNPWGSKSLEWTTETPPPPGNWAEVPTVSEDWHPYGYEKK